jgi:DNA polymerase elongation subunit (family B)
MEKKILLLDIEATSLFGSIGTIVAIGVFDPKNFKKPFIYFVNNSEEEPESLKWLKEQISKGNYTAICGWNIKGYDLPFLIARATKLNFDFSSIKKLEQVDLLEIARKIFKLHSYKMRDVCEWLGIPHNVEIKAHMIDELYHKFLAGDKNSGEKIKEKCETDLIGLAELFEKMKLYFNLTTKKPWSFS